MDSEKKKAGRKRIVPLEEQLQNKIDTYLKEYKIDDLNEANDKASLTSMCQLELALEKLDAVLLNFEITSDPKGFKDMTTARRDTVASWVSLQKELGINRSTRQSESDESPQSYIDKLKKKAKKFMEMRLKILECVECHMPLLKYHVYIKEKGEEGAIAYKDIVIENIKYSLTVECSKCGNKATVTHEGDE